MRQRSYLGTTWFQVLFGLAVAGLIWSVSKSGSPALVILIAIGYILVLRYGTGPLARLIARTGYSIRWKFEIAIIVVSVVFLGVGLISFSAMEFMHHNAAIRSAIYGTGAPLRWVRKLVFGR